MEKILEFKLDQKTMSMNQAYSVNNYGRRFLIKEGKEYKKMISLMVKVQANKNKLKYKNFKRFSCVYLFGFKNGLKKDGEIKKGMYDYDSGIKLLQDAIFETLGYDDALIVSSFQEKSFKKDFIEVVVYGSEEKP